MPMQLRLQLQQNPVADEVSAVTAVVRPILEGLLYALKVEVARDAGGYENIRLRTLPRLYRPGDRDCGICFEYVVHDALNRRETVVLDRIHDAVRNYCNVPGQEPASILFGLEKTGALNLINTARERLTDESRLLAGNRGQPAKLKRHIDSLAAAFRKRDARESLPTSISGLWKADLFVGYTDTDRWIATTVKINPAHLEGARGLRIGVVPARGGRDDVIYRDDARNLIVCPLPHDQSFMEVFYQGWGVVQLRCSGPQPRPFSRSAGCDPVAPDTHRDQACGDTTCRRPGGRCHPRETLVPSRVQRVFSQECGCPLRRQSMAGSRLGRWVIGIGVARRNVQSRFLGFAPVDIVAHCASPELYPKQRLTSKGLCSRSMW